MKANSDYKEKIRKLLALAESTSENEAKEALLKARQLMAEHKLTEADLKYAESMAVKDVSSGITCSKRRNPWIVNLSGIIANNYCCKAYRRHESGKHTQLLGFIGLEDDAEICVTIFKYAVDCILAEIERRKKEYEGLFGSDMKRICDSYGYGFCHGIEKALEKQQEDNQAEWGLVLAIPEEVISATKHFGNKQFAPKAQENISASAFYEGYAQGKEFDPKRRLEATAGS